MPAEPIRFAAPVLLAEELAMRLALGVLAGSVPGFAAGFVAGIDQLLKRNPTPAGVAECLAELRNLVVAEAMAAGGDHSGNSSG